MAKPTAPSRQPLDAPRWFAIGVLALLGTAGIVRGFWQPSPGTVASVRALGEFEPRPSRPGATPAASRTVDLNTATAAELDLLPGIGPALAGRIIEFRESNGPFDSLDDLDAVRGIGPKTIAKLTPFASAN